MQREPINLRAQRALHQRLPATIAADATIALACASAERCAPFDRRRRETGQQFVAGTVADFRRSIRVHPLPRLAQRPQHPIADPPHQLLHVGIVHFRLRVELRLTAARSVARTPAAVAERWLSHSTVSPSAIVRVIRISSLPGSAITAV